MTDKQFDEIMAKLNTISRRESKFDWWLVVYCTAGILSGWFVSWLVLSGWVERFGYIAKGGAM